MPRKITRNIFGSPVDFDISDWSGQGLQFDESSGEWVGLPSPENRFDTLLGGVYNPDAPFADPSGHGMMSMARLYGTPYGAGMNDYAYEDEIDQLLGKQGSLRTAAIRSYMDHELGNPDAGGLSYTNPGGWTTRGAALEYLDPAQQSRVGGSKLVGDIRNNINHERWLMDEQVRGQQRTNADDSGLGSLIEPAILAAMSYLSGGALSSFMAPTLGTTLAPMLSGAVTSIGTGGNPLTGALMGFAGSELKGAMPSSSEMLASLSTGPTDSPFSAIDHMELPMEGAQYGNYYPYEDYPAPLARSPDFGDGTFDDYPAAPGSNSTSTGTGVPGGLGEFTGVDQAQQAAERLEQERIRQVMEAGDHPTGPGASTGDGSGWPDWIPESMRPKDLSGWLKLGAAGVSGLGLIGGMFNNSKRNDQARADRERMINAQAARQGQIDNPGTGGYGWSSAAPLARISMNPGVNAMYGRGTATPQQRMFFDKVNPHRAAKGGEVPIKMSGLSALMPPGGGEVDGDTPGQGDVVPAMLAAGEYVWDADVVAALGDGNTAAGAKVLDAARERIRTHKRSAPKGKIPPKAKAFEKYLGGKA